MLYIFAVPIRNDADLFDGDQSFANHTVEFGEEGLDAIRGVHDLDHQGEVLREADDFGGVDAAVSAEPEEALAYVKSAQRKSDTVDLIGSFGNDFFSTVPGSRRSLESLVVSAIEQLRGGPKGPLKGPFRD
jgi:hypothetical protein